ncbi:MAG TPA: cytochrome C oxidase subunit IV family protein [Polyangiaceae bacterium]|nr:cytochrome C oxidase subunit IV family protein [Polyangiaceae bacterium]
MEPEATKPTERAMPLVLAWALLCALTATSFGARYLPLGVFATPVALAIALAKASVVLVSFMRLRHEATSVRLLVWVAFGTVVLACAGVIGDAGFRELAPGPQFATTEAHGISRQEP